ncbi:indole-3-glycerol phosphate synthase TrpC [Desulforamulus ruminis]|uniref:indole-3-glycerol phosphate synthase TrpC n=1 Tax=Desulforamulus ruminis TaxID=1564 RepID=UPI002FDB18FD
MILDRILEVKRSEVQGLLERFRVSEMAREAAQLPPARDFRRAIDQPGRVSLIAEIKKQSPSKGLLCRFFDPCRLARIYRDHGAAAVSVLTDRTFFGGKGEYLAQVRQEVDLPLLRKDFILDPVQIYESRLLGADAVLLIVAALSRESLSRLLELCREVGLQALVEVHSEEELERAIKAGADLIGINNRNLQTFATELQTTLRLMELVKKSAITVVSESGIHHFRDMSLLKAMGVQAALVGEALVTAPDIGLKVQELTKGGGALAL